MTNTIFNLPPVQSLNKIEKEYIKSEPDLSMLNNGQQEAFDKLWYFLTETSGGMILLQGYAGTGKSFLIGKIIQKYLYRFGTNNVAITAPTNKAVKVLRNFSSYTHSNLKYSTIHSLLGLKEKIDAYGNQTFERDYNEPCALDSYKVLILDECSMLSDYIFELLIPFVEQGLQLIFMGDPCQINPINKDEAIPLNKTKQLAYGIGVCELTDIVRQKEGNPIIETTMTIRTNIHRDNCLIFRDSSIHGEIPSGVIHVNSTNASECGTLEKVMEHYFTSDNFKENTDFVKVIAWRNKTVDAINNRVRKYLFGNDLCKLEIGERLIANRPIISDMMILFTTNDEMTVVSHTIQTEKISDSVALMYYCTQVKNENDEIKEINIIHEDSETAYKNLLDALRKSAMDKPKGSFAAKAAWESYFEFLGYFADVKYCYAITAHKSQGSTYDTVIVYENDINFNQKVVERNRLKYTAMSRPSRLLYIFK